MTRRLNRILSTAFLTLVAAGCAPSQSAEQGKPASDSEQSQQAVQQDPDEPAQAEPADEPSSGDEGSEGDTEAAAETPTLEVQRYEAESCTPLEDDLPTWGARGEPNAAYEDFLASAQSLGERMKTSDSQRDVFSISAKHRDECVSWTGLPTPEFEDRPFEGDCVVEIQRDRQVSVIYQTTFCGGDACTIRYFVWDGSQPTPVHLDIATDFGRISAAAADGVVVFDAGVLPPKQRNTYRLDTKTGEVCVLTDQCFSPRVAPDGETVVCRNNDSDVLAVSLDGGDAEVIHDVDIPSSKTTYLRPQWGSFPGPVQFLEDGTVKYEVVLENKPAGSSETSKRVDSFEWPSD